jgi:hypothetical protein
MSIAPQRISQVDVRASGPDPIQLRRDKPETLDMTLMDIPKGRTQAPAPISALGGALNALYFDTVKAKADIDMTGAQTIRYRLFEGPVIDVRVKRIDGKAYATFTVGPDKDLSEAAAKIVSDLNAKTAPFVFGLSTQKADEMTISKEGLLAKLDGARPPAPKGQN